MVYSPYLGYPYAGEKFKYTYTELFFRKVAYTRFNVLLFVQWVSFDISITVFLTNYRREIMPLRTIRTLILKTNLICATEVSKYLTAQTPLYSN
jgi:hypothetical protein